MQTFLANDEVIAAIEAYIAAQDFFSDGIQKLEGRWVK